jgi:hypothetical protein
VEASSQYRVFFAITRKLLPKKTQKSNPTHPPKTFEFIKATLNQALELRTAEIKMSLSAYTALPFDRIWEKQIAAPEREKTCRRNHGAIAATTTATLLDDVGWATAALFGDNLVA